VQSCGYDVNSQRGSVYGTGTGVGVGLMIKG
jgi:hypothetical protein